MVRTKPNLLCRLFCCHKVSGVVPSLLSFLYPSGYRPFLSGITPSCIVVVLDFYFLFLAPLEPLKVKSSCRIFFLAPFEP